MLFARIFQVSTLSVIVTASWRTRRIIHGTDLESRDTPYRVIRYYTWISNGHECDTPAPEFFKKALDLHENWEFPTSVFGFQCPPTPSAMKCSGALITPFVVQTACHCLASFVKVKRFEPRPPRVRSHWETLLRVYIGHSRVDKMRAGVPSTAYIIHQKCSELGVYPEWTIHDYGWITLSFAANKYLDLGYGPIGFSPQYPLEELSIIWHYVTKTSPVCLYIGFGSYKNLPDGENDPTRSSVLKIGWNVNVDYTTCHYYTHVRESFKISKFNYSQDATWSCATTFPKHEEVIGSGDSGGPVTCNGHYFGIVSQNKLVATKLGYKWLVLNNAIAYAVYQNAIEFKKEFMVVINDWNNYIKAYSLPTFKPMAFVGSSKRAATDNSGRISSPLILIQLSLIVLNFCSNLF